VPRRGLIPFVAGAVLLAASLVPGVGSLYILGFSVSGLLQAAAFSYGLRAVASIRTQTRQDLILDNPASPNAPMCVVYGVAKVGLRIVDVRTVPTDSSLLYIVGAISIASQDGSGIHDVQTVFFDDRNAIGGVLEDAAFGTSGVQAPWIRDGVTHIFYSLHSGTDAQTHDTNLNSVFPSEWPVTSDGRGICYIVLRLKSNPDIFPGIPNITVALAGNKVFDPRNSTTAISLNPALCIRDYLTSTKYGCSIPSSEIDDVSFSDAANYCDENVNTTAYNGVRFTCNGAIDTSQPRQQVLSDLLSSCRGDLVHQGGKYRLVIRRVQSPVSFALTEDNIVGDWEFSRTGADAPNSITISWVDPLAEFQAREVTWPEAGAANGFLTADNNIASHVRIELPMTTNIYIAQQIGMVTLREAREDVSIAVTAKEAALILQVGDVVNLTHSTPGFSAKPFWVSAMAINPDATVRLVLREYDAAAYTLDTQNTDPTVPGSGLPDPFVAAAPTNLVLTSGAGNTLTTQDGLRVPRIKATWTAAAETFLSHYEMQFKRNADSAWIALPNVLRTETETFVTPVANGVAYDVRIRSVNTTGVTSAWVTVTNHTVTTLPTIRLVARPEVSESVVRTDESATLSLVIFDPALKVTAIEFNKREGDGSATGYVDTWDNTSGTEGVDDTLTRDEAVAIEDGKDSEIRWRVTYTDDSGNSVEIHNTVHLANLQTLEKVLRIPFGELLPNSDTSVWTVTAEYIVARTTAGLVAYASIVLPVGVTITQFSARMYRNSSSDAAAAQLFSVDNAGSGSTMIAECNHSTTGWQTVNDSLSESVTTDKQYVGAVVLSPVTTNTNARFMWFELTYTVPTYAASY